MTLRTLLSALFPPSLRAERDSLQLQCAALRATLDRRDSQIVDLTDRLQKVNLVAQYAISRAELADSQLAELRGRIEPMAMVYPWLNEESKVTA